MQRTRWVIGIIGCLLASLCAHGQAGGSTHKIVLPNPKLIRCHSAECSQLWKQVDGSGAAVYPAQVLTDLVNGEIVGLTAAYDKSVSSLEIRSAFDTFYGKSRVAMSEDSKTTAGLWRVESEQLVIQLSERGDGVKQVIYLKVGAPGSHVPTAHIFNETEDCK